MANVTHDNQCFHIDNRRVWVLGAAMSYARIPEALWASRIADAKQAGFNTIQIACPWALHEPRKGRYTFDGQANVKRFIELCGEADMYVILQAGPYVGQAFDGGGLPSWLLVDDNVPLRESDESFMRFAGTYLRKLLNPLTSLQATKGGPIILIQAEHGWTCGNDTEANKYLAEIVHVIQETGINVPLINANDLWVEGGKSIATWRGWDDLLLALRQLRTVQPKAPRLVSALQASLPARWGHEGADERPAMEILRHTAQCLAAGSQVVVNPFVAGTNFGFSGGRLPGQLDGYVTTTAGIGSPVGEAGHRGEAYHLLKRLMMFANHFDHVFGDLNPDYHPVVLDLEETDSRSSRRAAKTPHVAIVPQRGSNGRVVFVFTDGEVQDTTLLLDDGLRMPVPVGEQPVSWFLIDVDLHGAGRLDYANLCPWAVVDRNVVVFHGPAGAHAYFSINGRPIDADVPGGKTPLVLEHEEATIVICNREQIDAAYVDDKHVYIGCAGFDADGELLPASGFSTCFVISREGEIEKRKMDTRSTGPRRAKSIALSGWKASESTAYIDGSSPRFASLAGPESLSDCGAPEGYGWYRVVVKSKSAKKRLVMLPRSGDRVHLYFDGEMERLVGFGLGAEHEPFDMKLARGELTIVALADNLGRFSSGNDIGLRKGVHGHFYEVKPLRAIKGKTVTATAVEPFALRQFIEGQSAGIASDTEQVLWSFTHRKKSPIVMAIDGASVSGTVVLNDEPIAYYAGATGARFERIVLEPDTLEPFKRGKNELRFAPDPRQDGATADVIKHVTLYECFENLTADADWSFAKWEPPAKTTYRKLDGSEKVRRGVPCWFRTTFENPAGDRPVWIDTDGMSKGQVFINGQNLGRYFTATATAKRVGPQTRLWIPRSWLKGKGKTNELLVFDEHGFAPAKMRLVLRETGELD